MRDSSSEIRHRLFAAIDSDQRTANQISKDAGLGRNYIQQLKNNRKSPGIEKLVKILDTLGTHSAVFVLTGLNVNKEDIEALELISSLPAEAKVNALAFFRSLAPPSNS